jgi:hypothetical protein
MAPSPALVVIGPGSVIELKNNDKMAHDISIPENASLMPLQRLSPGAVRRQKFTEPGGYVVRCSDYPHIAFSVVVVSSSYFDTTDEKGAYKIDDVAEGKGTIKVWSHGRWIHEAPLEVRGKTHDLPLKLAESGKDVE